tara:strand:- start:55 stop:666 length:612 start_codon:yes stop_codon:yes gene_type:complete
MNTENIAVIDTLVITAATGKLITTATRSEYSTKKSRKAAYDAAYAEGVRADMVVKGNPVRDQVKDFMFDGLPAAERKLINSSKADYTPQEWDVQKHLKSQATKELGSLVTKFRLAMERREKLEKKPKPAEAEEATEEVIEEATEEAPQSTPEERMICVVEGYIKSRQEDEDWPNAVEIAKTGRAFINALTIVTAAEVEAALKS